MQGYWTPPFWNQLEPLWRNAVDNPIAVQWIHRALGTALLVLVLVAWAVLRRDPTVSGDRRGALALFVVLLIGQFWLGVFTLVWMVPLALGVMHQVMACLICGASVYMIHSFRGAGHA